MNIEQFDPRQSRLPLVLTFLGGLSGHALDQLVHFRAGPIPPLITAPIVAVLAYVYVSPEMRRPWLAALLCWSGIGSGIALLGVYLVSTSYRLPRPLSDPALVAYDLGLFLWFVVSLTGVYVMTAGRTPRKQYTVLAALVGPMVQFGWILLVIGFVELGQHVG